MPVLAKSTVCSCKLVVLLQVDRRNIFLAIFVTSFYFFEFKGSAPLHAFGASKWGHFCIDLKRQNLLQTILLCSVDRETYHPSHTMFQYLLLVNEVVLFLIIFLKMAADAAWNQVSCLGPLSQLKTSRKQMKLCHTILLVQNLPLSPFKLFRVGKCPFTDINKWPCSRKWWCILRNLPHAVREFKNWPSKCFYFVLHSCHAKDAGSSLLQIFISIVF
jgi:hypothetical protein